MMAWLEMERKHILALVPFSIGMAQSAAMEKNKAARNAVRGPNGEGFYVYAHKVGRKTVYVGRGTGWRAYQFTHRSKRWRAFFTKAGAAPTVKILGFFNTRDESMVFEAGCIVRFRPPLNDHYLHAPAGAVSALQGRINGTQKPAKSRAKKRVAPVAGEVSPYKLMLALRQVSNGLEFVRKYDLPRRTFWRLRKKGATPSARTMQRFADALAAECAAK